MPIVLFYHSLISDWNHGNTHFLRGIGMALFACGHQVESDEPQEGWTLQQLRHEQGLAALQAFHAAQPGLSSRTYAAQALADHGRRTMLDAQVQLQWTMAAAGGEQ